MIKTYFPGILKRHLSPLMRGAGEEGPAGVDIKAALMKSFKEINEVLFTS